MASKHVAAVIDACTASIAKRDEADAASSPSTLFHFTDLDGLAGILSTNILWASLATELNDASEVRYGLDLAEEVLRERIASAATDFDVAALEFLVDPSSAPRPNRFELFPLVISLCGRADKSGMWLHYGRGGRGVALGFDSSIAIEAKMNLSCVDYDPGSQRTRIAELLHAGREALGASPPPSHVRDGAHLTSMYMSWLAIRFKHPSFSEEHEWRLSVQAIAQDGRIQDDTTFKYRRQGERLIPYEERRLNGTALLREVILGHSCSFTVEAGRALLASHSCTAAVVRSNVPVR
ncbi:MAG: DUF2971 domain-containing protein [Polyangiaceae bacterium]|nr:DUF2971 domain-containing protein [Polyangiaceae bacterium]